MFLHICMYLIAWHGQYVSCSTLTSVSETDLTSVSEADPTAQRHFHATRCYICAFANEKVPSHICGMSVRRTRWKPCSLVRYAAHSQAYRTEKPAVYRQKKKSSSQSVWSAVIAWFWLSLYLWHMAVFSLSKAHIITAYTQTDAFCPSMIDAVLYTIIKRLSITLIYETT